MITLAFEWSASPCSLALLRDDEIVAERTWITQRSGGSQMFSNLADLLREAGLAPERIERYAVGLGPGSFAGVRMALTTARVMALPGDRNVYGLPSPELTARALIAIRALPSIAVVGDARRQRLWLARYRNSAPNGIEPDGPIRLIAVSELSAGLQGVAAVATPHAATLGQELKARAPADARIFDTEAVPSSVMAGRWAPRYGQEDRADAPLAPIYLHPPPPLQPVV